MSRFSLLLTLTATLIASHAALSGEIYKWVDENGNVHYVDRPSGAPTEERVNIVSRSTDNSSVQASIDARRERVAQREEARAEREEKEAEAAKAQAELEDRKKKCEQYRARLERFLASQRLYREDESGERTYLEENEIIEARNRVQAQIQEYCN